MSDMTRRNALHALALGPAMAVLGSAMPGGAQERAGPSTSLVAYFSRTGNTRVIAHQIRRAKSADIFEIVPATPYPEDYEQTVEQARLETADGFRPELSAMVEEVAGYKTVYLGMPIWGTTAPPIIRSFLAAHDFGVKTIVPFITHGGYGVGSALEVLGDHAPGADVAEPFVIEADQERRTLDQVTGWLATLPT